MHAAPNGRPVSGRSRCSHGTQPEMLTPSNVTVNQQEQKADREKWVVGAVTHSPLTVIGVENDKLASVA